MKILVVDDEFVALTKMITVLSEFGDCDAATNGGQALEMFMDSFTKGVLYDLMTIDIEMPDVNGLKVLHLICKNEQKLHLQPAKKIIVSASGSDENKIAAAGFHCEFLVKPVKRETIIDMLKQMSVVLS